MEGCFGALRKKGETFAYRDKLSLIRFVNFTICGLYEVEVLIIVVKSKILMIFDDFTQRNLFILHSFY